MDDVLKLKSCKECSREFMGTPEMQLCSYCAILNWAKALVAEDQRREDEGLEPIDYDVCGKELRKNLTNPFKKQD